MPKNQNSYINVLKNKSFVSLWIGQFISFLADRLVQMAFLAWLIFTFKKSGSELARITFFSILPLFLFSGLAGAAADRLSRKWIMALSNFLRGIFIFVVAYFFLRPSVPVEFFYVSLFMLGIFSSFFVPSRLSITPNIVEKSSLEAANALSAGAGTVATLIGTYVAGYLFDRGAYSQGLLINSGLYLVAGALMLLIVVPAKTTEAQEIKEIKSVDLKGTFSYLKSHKRAKDLIFLSTALSVLTSFFYITLTVLAIDYFHLGTQGLGKLLCMLGVGIIAGSLFAPSVLKRNKAAHSLIFSYLVICVGTGTAKLVSSYSMAFIWLFLIGFSNALIVVSIDTIQQKITPDRFRGKIFGFRSMVTNGLFLISILGAGEALKITSPFEVFHFLSLGSLLVALVVLFVNEKVGYWVLRFIANLILRVFFSLRVEGNEFLRFRGKMILAGNHTGYLDGPVVMAAFNRPVRFLVSAKVFSWAFIGPIVKRMHIVPVEEKKGRDALTRATQCLMREDVIAIFPEGKLTRDGKIGPFYKGVARLHTESKAPIIPFVIHGGYEAWPWLRKMPKRRQITIQFGQPIKLIDKDEATILNEIKERVQFMKEALERREDEKNDIKAYEKSALHLMQLKSDVYGGRTALLLKEKSKWKELSYIELSRRARDLSDYLIESGFKKGDRVVILSESRPEWAVAFFASIRSGAITVPLDIKLTDAELKSILSNALPKILFVSVEHAKSASVLKESIPSIEKVILVGDHADNGEFPLYSTLRSKTTLEGCVREPHETALIIYTSGTTGNPKGVMISFSNLIFEVRNLEHKLSLGPDDLFLSILPLNHLLELTAGFLGVLHAGGKVCYSQSLYPQEIAKMMSEKKVTLMITVPLFLKLIKGSIEKQIKKESAFGQKYFRAMYVLSKFIPFVSIRKRLFLPIHKQFGGRLKGFVSGGAPLDVEVGEFFGRIGIPVYQGYGLSETSPITTANVPGQNRLGSVGRPLEGAEVKIAQVNETGEGEILTRGPHIMQGYYKRDDLTKEVIDAEGWFHTGDLGRFDKDGYLYITGRIKSLIVLGGGKKIHPEEVESVLSNSALVKEVCVASKVSKEGLKEGTEEVCAVIAPSDDLKKKADKMQMEQELKKEIERLNQNLASYKRPTRIFIYPEDLPKTATRKIKRSLILEWLKSQ